VKRVAISGASGLVGRALSLPCASGLRHRRTFTQARTWGDSVESRRRLDVSPLEGIYAVIHLAGENVGVRWTSAVKQRIMDSRVHGTRSLCTAVLDCSDGHR